VKHFFFECWQYVLFALREFFTVLTGGGECAVCGTRCGAVPVCRACRNAYFVPPQFAVERCSGCGKELISEHGLCMQCRTEKLLTHTDFVFPLYSYRLWNSVLLFRWKIDGERALSPFFAERLASALSALPPELVIVPVPPRPGKIRKKGWDQIEEICMFLELQWKYCVCRILERKTTEEQKTLDRAERLATIDRAYSLKNGSSLRNVLRRTGGLLPESVCLIDDVMTTGATIESCAAVLKKAGIKKVYAVTLFIVD
jgi:competence protein ComFC